MTSTALGVRLTPNNSPSVRPPASIRSPTKSNHDELSLSLKRVIGSTTNSSNAFDCQPTKRRFAYTAGAAAVIANVDSDLQITQQFFRARPTASSTANAVSSFVPTTPTRGVHEQELRNKAISSLRDAGVGRDGAEPPPRGWAESPGAKPWAAKERVKAATSVSFSPDGKFLAVGETGYRPRVLIFRIDDDRSNDSPMAMMTEHSYGVQCVAFSPDSQFLASLGTINDGFLHIWRVGHRGNAVLHSSAKCTSTVRQIAWAGSALIAVGTRHIKVWRLDAPLEPVSPRKARQSEFGSPMSMSPLAKSLPARNAILGDLLESTFTTVVAMSSDTAAVCSDRGDVCILDVGSGHQTLRKVANVEFPVFSAAFHGDQLVLAGEKHRLRALSVKEAIISNCDIATGTASKSPHRKSLGNDSYIAAIACFATELIVVDSQDGVKIFKGFSFDAASESNVLDVNISASDEAGESNSILNHSILQDVRRSSFDQKLPGHCSAVLGVQAIPVTRSLDSSFFTWSSDGLVHFWDSGGGLKHSMRVPLGGESSHADHPNELRVVRAFPSFKYFATGDKYGVLRIVDRDASHVIFDVQAHSGEILDVVVFDVDEITLVCSAGRDRIVQVFEHKKGETLLSQSLDEHVSVVNGLLFTPKDTRLLSCSFDRTIVIRDRYIQEDDGNITSAFVISRTINMKSAPVTMSLTHNASSLIVSSTDRSVMIYDIELRKAVRTFKASDTEKGDPVVLSAVAHWKASNGSSLIAGISSTDKSVRLYQEDGTLVGRDWGHTEGISDIAILYEDEHHEKASIVTVAADGTIFLWAASHEHAFTNDAFDRVDAFIDHPLPSELKSTKPLRRLLSHSDLALFRPASENATPRTSPIASPDPNRSPRLRSRTSRMSLAQPPKLEPAAPSSIGIPPTPARHHRSPTSPLSPKPHHSRTNTDLPSRSLHRPSLDARHRTKSAGNLKTTASSASSSTSLSEATSQLLRALRTYRQSLVRSPTFQNQDVMRTVEREMQLTAKAMAEKVGGGSGAQEGLGRVLDEYCEKVVRMLDERVERRVREVGGIVEEGELVGNREEQGQEGEGIVEVKEEDERRGSV